MNQARKTQPVYDTDLRSVLQTISAAPGFDPLVDNLDGPFPVLDAAQPTPPPSLIRRNLVEEVDPTDHSDLPPENIEIVSLRINPDSHPNLDDQVEDVLERTFESVTQIKELAARLNANEAALMKRETELADRISCTAQTEHEQRTELDQQRNQLNQQASQVRCQQLHLMQLQTDIVKSYEATRQAIENLVIGPSSDLRSIEILQALKQQLSGRFDYIARRWEHLSELMKNSRTQAIAQQSLDDSVDWTGDLS